ncbi:alkaline protease secretion ATP-binding protein aprD [Asticcacaulis biprosthecium C19]|uniref:Alkaline protease secretion ATP-binding protein aprD n=2 Tax=Asticcacaulis biprosthecium TaxID=76891 RepID=F4QP15_9CAUL|nr:alkaline protease secretion ATP-binding protein aprD [Asticcacaulis biprosthecium C19]
MTLLALRRYVTAAAGFTLAINLLMLVSPLHMIQVYDRVLTSGSVDTLVLITGLAVVLLLVYAVADAGRKSIFSLLGRRFAERLELPVFASAAASPDAARDVSAAMGSLATVQKFVISGGPAPFFDAPYVPLFALLLFFIHPWLGAIGLAGALILIGLAVVMELTTRMTVEETGRREGLAQAFLAGASRQYSAVAGMGMASAVFRIWQRLKSEASDIQSTSGDRSNLLAAISRSLRQVLQVIMLSAGAYLTLKHEVSPGAIIASSIILSRALAPVDQALGQWAQIVKVREAWNKLVMRLPPEALDASEVTPIPRPEGKLSLEGLSIGVPGGRDPLIARMGLALEPGSLMVVIGANGSGKTSFLQTLTGAWPVHSGIVRLGGRDIHAWAGEDRGRYVGYLPQDVELLPGTVRENIARFSEGEPEPVFEAVRLAGCSEAILRMGKGFDTPVGPGGVHVSAGQRQSIGLARALYGDPVLLVLDEPTAHLDSTRAAAMAGLLRDLKAGGRVMIVATHDLNILNVADQVMNLSGGYASVASGEDYRKSLAEYKRNAGMPIAREVVT